MRFDKITLQEVYNLLICTDTRELENFHPVAYGDEPTNLHNTQLQETRRGPC